MAVLARVVARGEGGLLAGLGVWVEPKFVFRVAFLSENGVVPGAEGFDPFVDGWVLEGRADERGSGFGGVEEWEVGGLGMGGGGG